MFGRWVGQTWHKQLAKPYVHLVFGARQTGKSTLLRELLPNAAIWLDFSRPAERIEYLRNPDLLVQRCRALAKGRAAAVVVIDEAQNVPAVFDAVQHLYDSDKQRWRLVLCGSSARKLRTSGSNLLPGRSVIHQLYPLMLTERPAALEHDAPALAGNTLLALPSRTSSESNLFPAVPLIERLTFGELPAIAVAKRDQRAALLHAYAMVYLEEELRREALVKNWPAFARFLHLAAVEAGRIINYAAISRDAGVSLPTVKTYYQLLEDMFMGFRVTAFSGSARKSVLSTERFFFFDVGVRNAAAELPLEAATVRANPGHIFEQWVGIELWKRLQYLGNGKLHYQRTKAGREVDFIIARGSRLTPIEVKWTERPTHADARHLLMFLDEHPKVAPHGYVVCRCPYPLQLHERVTALPWQMI